MRRNALAMIAKSNYLDYRSKQLELINNIASLVHVFGIDTCVRNTWFFDHSDEDLSFHLCYTKPSQHDLCVLPPLQRRRAQGWHHQAAQRVLRPAGTISKQKNCSLT